LTLASKGVWLPFPLVFCTSVFSFKFNVFIFEYVKVF